MLRSIEGAGSSLIRFCGSPKSLLRLGLVLSFWVTAYLVAQQPDIRLLYAQWDKLFHALIFVGLWASFYWSWQSSPWLLSWVCLTLGLLIELHQMMLPGFNPSFGDWVADAVGIAFAHGVSLKYKRVGK
jgi:VanZ family protein